MFSESCLPASLCDMYFQCGYCRLRSMHVALSLYPYEKLMWGSYDGEFLYLSIESWEQKPWTWYWHT